MEKADLRLKLAELQARIALISSQSHAKEPMVSLTKPKSEDWGYAYDITWIDDKEETELAECKVCHVKSQMPCFRSERRKFKKGYARKYFWLECPNCKRIQEIIIDVGVD
jgi:hypothetical protein